MATPEQLEIFLAVSSFATGFEEGRTSSDMTILAFAMLAKAKTILLYNIGPDKTKEIIQSVANRASNPNER